MLFCKQIMHTRKEQFIFDHLELRIKIKIKKSEKYERRSVLSTLQPFVEGLSLFNKVATFSQSMERYS